MKSLLGCLTGSGWEHPHRSRSKTLIARFIRSFRLTRQAEVKNHLVAVVCVRFHVLVVGGFVAGAAKPEAVTNRNCSHRASLKEEDS